MTPCEQALGYGGKDKLFFFFLKQEDFSNRNGLRVGLPSGLAWFI